MNHTIVVCKFILITMEKSSLNVVSVWKGLQNITNPWLMGNAKSTKIISLFCSISVVKLLLECICTFKSVSMLNKSKFYSIIHTYRILFLKAFSTHWLQRKSSYWIKNLSSRSDWNYNLKQTPAFWWK